MEEEWGKLIIEMLEREKLLRPAVERSVLSPRRGRPLLLPPATGTPQTPSLTSPCHCRLELLLQIANKIQNGALSCEEKLTLAKNTLQAVSGGWFYPFVCFPALLSCPSPPLFFFLSFLPLSLSQRCWRGCTDGTWEWSCLGMQQVGLGSCRAADVEESRTSGEISGTIFVV